VGGAGGGNAAAGGVYNHDRNCRLRYTHSTFTIETGGQKLCDAISKQTRTYNIYMPSSRHSEKMLWDPPIIYSCMQLGCSCASCVSINNVTNTTSTFNSNIVHVNSDDFVSFEAASCSNSLPPQEVADVSLCGLGDLGANSIILGAKTFNLST